MEQEPRDELPPQVRRFALWRWTGDDWSAIGGWLLWGIFAVGILSRITMQLAGDWWNHW
ncbi:MAG TPA: hypothetical protein VFG20_19505 [Planctomycetaceae bacterium]|jgi:hypothetical protein|nr:hypothetical protein [Planctomycetaceae bacterium]